MSAIVAFAAVLCATALHAQNPIRVACVGDSITYGSRIEGRESNSYPAVLQRLLGEKFKVRNFGVSGMTLLKKGDKPYWKNQVFKDATDFEPNIVIIKLGTNDSKPQNRTNITEFASDLAAMVDHFAALETKPRIYLCLPVPVFQTLSGINEASVAGEIVPAIKKVAAEKKLPMIDLHTALSGEPSLFPDGVHPDTAGAKAIAETVYASIR
jgi:lysophospholipase L1-like esterase